jgi:hypothetical protein
MALKLAMAVAAGLILSGCATRYTPAPLAANFPTTKQAKLQATYHWGIVANAIERQLAAQLKKTPTRPVFINVPADPNPFQRALATQLTTSLVNDGFTVARTPAGALKIDLDVQTLTFAANRRQYNSYFGQRVPLADGVWMAQELTAPRVENEPLDPLDSEYAPGATPRTEIIVTISVSDQYRYLARSTSAYYVADADYALYGIVDPEPENTKLTRVFKVRGDL